MAGRWHVLLAVVGMCMCLFMTDGVSSRGEGDATARAESAQQAARILGAASPAFNDFPDNAMDTVPVLEIVRVIERSVAEIGPSCILTHHHGDLTWITRSSIELSLTACRPQPGPPGGGTADLLGQIKHGMDHQ